MVDFRFWGSRKQCISQLSLCNKFYSEATRVHVVFWFLVMEAPSMMEWLCGIWTWGLEAHRIRSMCLSKTINTMQGAEEQK
jgi:hypothetical protein